MPVGLSDSFFCAVYTHKNCQFGKQEFFRWRGEFCHFKTGIPGGPVLSLLRAGKNLGFLEFF